MSQSMMFGSSSAKQVSNFKIVSSDNLADINEKVEEFNYIAISDEHIKTLIDERDNPGVNRPRKSITAGQNN